MEPLTPVPTPSPADAPTPLLAWGGRLAQAVRRHPRRLMLGVLAVLMGSAVTAFGVATPTPSAPLPGQRQILEAVRIPDLQAQIAALEIAPRRATRTESTRAGDTIASVLRRFGIVDAQALAYLRQSEIVQGLIDGRPGRVVQATYESQRLVRLVLRGPDTSRSEGAERRYLQVEITQGDNGFLTHTQRLPLVAESRLAAGTVRTTLFAATDDAMLPDAVTGQLVNLFENDIDFRQDLRRGDRFTVMYEQLTAEGEPVLWAQDRARILAARFVNAGRIHEALWFQPQGVRGGYFDFDGRSTTRQFLSAPLEYSRVTSGFSMRVHPLFHRLRAHLGVDYAAPEGTPVRSVGEGTVVFSGVQGGYGNMVIVRHDDRHETRYGHLSRIDARLGQRLEQGSSIGAVGATGWATGPHLHFEFRVDGNPKDPLAVARESEAARIPPSALPQFQRLAADTQSQFEAAQTTVAQARRFE